MIMIQRIDQYGKLYVNGKFQCYTLDPGKLEPGLYKLEISYSPKFKCKLPLIYNDKFSPSRGFRIHAGNSLCDTTGCILVGDSLKLSPLGVTLYNSKDTLSKLMEVITDDILQII